MHFCAIKIPIIDESKNWSEYHFINVMMHELGHALGLPHARPEVSTVMRSHGYRCNKLREICKIGEGDFDKIVEYYNPKLLNMSAQEYYDYSVKKVAEREQKSQGGGGGGGYGSRFGECLGGCLLY